MGLIGIILFVTSLSLGAKTHMTTWIHDIDYGSRSDDEVLVFLGNGQVVKLRNSHHTLSVLMLKEKWYQMEIDDQRYISNIKETSFPFQVTKHSKIFQVAPMSYIPTTVKDMKTAQRYHREARYNPKESQCFNRAHVWSYEWWKRHSLRSMKILIYFTRTYIRRYNFEWWFHIAPYIHVMDEGVVKERVLDIKYTSGPRSFQKWANIFLRNDHPCPVITKFSNYADHPYTGECYFQRTHMYTYQPADLQMYEAWGFEKNNWLERELRWAYEEAFTESF